MRKISSEKVNVEFTSNIADDEIQYICFEGFRCSENTPLCELSEDDLYFIMSKFEDWHCFGFLYLIHKYLDQKEEATV